MGPTRLTATAQELVMTLLDHLRRVASQLVRARRSNRRPHSDPSPSVVHESGRQGIGEADDRAGEGAVGFSGGPGEDALDSMTAEELSRWENRDIPSIDRLSDDSEARADEKQEVTTSLNFPLHWTTAGLSWDYLFDFSVVCELFNKRPDDLVLDFAAGTCWATELLGRLGVRTVSMDLSLEMMRRGRERLAADSRLVFRDQAAFVAARGQALPF